MSSVEIKSKEIVMMPIEQIIDHPKNANRHSIEQIDRLCKLIQYQGFRSPLIISKRSGFLVSGHGRKMSAEKLGMTELPCVYQDFADESQEYAFVISENEIARWAELDKQAVHIELTELDIDIELLGIEDFNLIDDEEIDLPDLGDGSDSNFKNMTFTLSTGQADIVDDALKKAKKEFDCFDEINENSNGNALAEIVRQYVCS